MIRSLIGRAGLAAALGIGAMVGLAPSASAAEAAVSVAFDCTSIDVTSDKDISNVVLRFEDGDQKFDNLRGTSGTFSGSGTFEGAPIVAVFIKSGNNKSGEGPGYGERFDPPADACEGAAQANTAPAPAPEPAPAPAPKPEPAAAPAPEPAPAPAPEPAPASAPAPAAAVAAADTAAVTAPSPVSGLQLGQPAAPVAPSGAEVLGVHLTKDTSQPALAYTGAGTLPLLLAGLGLIGGGTAILRRTR